MEDTPSKLKIFTDEHIDSAIVDQLRRAGIDVLRCEDIGMKSADDSELLTYAAQNGYSLLSMDDDVTRLHIEYMQAGKHHKGIFFAPMARFQGRDGIGPIVRYCKQHSYADVRDRLLYVKK